MTYNPHTLFFFALATCLGFAGCATTRPIPYAGIASAPVLRPNTKGDATRIPYEYSSGAVLGDYSSILLEPVAIYGGFDQQFEKVTEDEKTTLADYMYREFREKLRHRYRMVSKPSPETLRIKLTLTGAKATARGLGTVTRFDLAGGSYNAVQSLRGKEGAFTGSISFAVELYDSTTNRLLSAYVEKQYPNAFNVKATWGALEASKEGIRKGAADLLDRLN